MTGPEHPYGLSAAEARYMPLLVNGYTNREIAELLRVSVSTVRFHLASVYVKLGVRNRVEAAVLWVREQERP